VSHTQGSARNDDPNALADAAKDFVDALQRECERLTDELATAVSRADTSRDLLSEAEDRIAQLEQDYAEAYAAASPEFHDARIREALRLSKRTSRTR
jgi:hypothetical protein